jgi:glutathione S-transferase
MDPKLYTFEESGNSYRIRLPAALQDIELQHIELDFLNDQQHSPEFLAFNPKGEVPAFVDGDKVFTDSAAILVYLAGTHLDKGSNKAPSSYWSSDVVEQAAIAEWLAFAASWVQYGVFTGRAILTFKGAFNGLGMKSSQESLAEAKIRGHKSLEILQQKLEKYDWLALGRSTIADIAVFAYVALAPMGG